MSKILFFLDHGAFLNQLFTKALITGKPLAVAEVHKDSEKPGNVFEAGKWRRQYSHSSDLFDKAMKFYNKEYGLDFDTLQAAYDDKYEDYREWLEELEPWNTDTLEDKGFMWDTIQGDLAVALEDSDDEEDEDDYV
jgi:hypothetical protein